MKACISSLKGITIAYNIMSKYLKFRDHSLLLGYELQSLQDKSIQVFDLSVVYLY